ncbi:MAG: CTP synthase [Candidatus Magasanikbacteria bacterium]|jgi:CTP synthase|nr:CTP synthase [Candidatus Magasanikbacteria bacterium]MBT6294713.1 CTP synthase [Candidatus Magasanikbacteria bacterium]
MAKKKRQTKKFIFVVGGVLSGVGKGVTTASLGAIFRAKGFSVTALKADPYVNVDAGTMNPTEHGEVYVTSDGDETDQDMGNYERFLEVELTSTNYMTTGRVYQQVIENERTMKYKGKCVQVVPHIPEEINRRIQHAAHINNADITIIEIGGTVGEYENILFLEAARRMKLANPEDVSFVLVSYLPVPSHIGEMKTKPTQQASRMLNGAGIQSDIIIARSNTALDAPRKEKLAVHCGVPKDHCISAPDVSSIYTIPRVMDEQHIGNKLLKTLGLKARKTNLSRWNALEKKTQSAKKEVRIGVVGKYFGSGGFTLSDSYISVIEAIRHAAWHYGVIPKLEWIDSEEFEKNPTTIKTLKTYHGVIVPGGFGTRGIEGIIQTISYVRKKHIPYLGICYGMQLATVEFARNVLKKKGAHTIEVDDSATHPIIHINPHQAKHVRENRYGGTMRLGSYDCTLEKGSKARELYKKALVSERHRHRYEFNNEYKKEMHKAGLRVVGINPESDLVEIVELEKHPFFIGVQFHPEFTSKPLAPHPLFLGLIGAALKK